MLYNVQLTFFTCACIFKKNPQVKRQYYCFGCLFRSTHAHTASKRLAPGCSVAPTISSADKRALLAAHNAVRRNARPAPYKPMAALTWDDNLASRAQELANTCKYVRTVHSLTIAIIFLPSYVPHFL